jgi:threonine/homoserine/homoserine lactone efflux protein
VAEGPKNREGKQIEKAGDKTREVYIRGILANGTNPKLSAVK